MRVCAYIQLTEIGWWWLVCLTAWIKRVFMRPRAWSWYVQLQESDELGHTSSRCVLDVQSFFRHACPSEARSGFANVRLTMYPNHFMIQLRSKPQMKMKQINCLFVIISPQYRPSTCARDFSRNDCMTLEYSVLISNNESNIHLIGCY